MKASELRIGNFGIDRDGRICIVEELSINEEPRIVAISGGLTSLPVTPILLTEEWLLKLGFEINKHEINSYKKEINSFFFCINIISGTCYINDGDGYEGADILNKCKHVHQLQNLYFALTGEELISK